MYCITLVHPATFICKSPAVTCHAVSASGPLSLSLSHFALSLSHASSSSYWYPLLCFVQLPPLCCASLALSLSPFLLSLRRSAGPLPKHSPQCTATLASVQWTRSSRHWSSRSWRVSDSHSDMGLGSSHTVLCAVCKVVARVHIFFGFCFFTLCRLHPRYLLAFFLSICFCLTPFSFVLSFLDCHWPGDSVRAPRALQQTLDICGSAAMAMVVPPLIAKPYSMQAMTALGEWCRDLDLYTYGLPFRVTPWNAYILGIFIMLSHHCHQCDLGSVLCVFTCTGWSFQSISHILLCQALSILLIRVRVIAIQ